MQSESSRTSGTFAPLRESTFRNIWTASLLSNFGQLILGVGAAWQMTLLTSSPSMVALIQTALMLPLMLVAVPAGALADMFDRRMLAMAGLAFSTASAATLTALAFAGMTTPWVLLGFCALIGTGVALYSPSWQASISEQVEPAHVPAAIALGSVSYNIARSFGPAIGGLIVLAAGAQAAFAINAVCYLPLLIAFFFWRRSVEPSPLPPERIDRAIVSGARYVFHSSKIRRVLVRTFAIGLASATAAALAPLIARDLLGGDASIYGLLLGAGGVGAVGGALFVSRVRERFDPEHAVRFIAIASGAMLAGLGMSRNLALSCLLFGIASGLNMMTIAMLNVTVQMAAPRWVTARALSLFQSAMTGGIAIGAWLWGMAATGWGVEAAMLASGAALASTMLLGFISPLPRNAEADVEPFEVSNEIEAVLPMHLRSGPVVIEIDYTVDAPDARAFHDAMQKVQRTRLRNGGFNWSLSRDIADPSLWTERYQCPTWGDYLRMRDRFTTADVDLHSAARAFDNRSGEVRVRRKLERPFGSVRRRADSPDLGPDGMPWFGP